jgi:hypothetical protein
MIRKFWKAARWSNLSAQMPAMTPTQANTAPDASANASIQSGWRSSISANQQADQQHAEADGGAANQSRQQVGEERIQDRTVGGSSTNTMLPVILDWISDDDELAKAFCSTDIMTRPGIRKAV